MARSVVTLVCPHCGKSFECLKKDAERRDQTRRRKYCGAKCYHAAQEEKIETVCAYCGKTLLKTPQRFHRAAWHFCNKSCKAKFLNPLLVTGHTRQPSPKGDQSPKWKGGIAYYGPGWQELRETYKRDAAYTCELCGVQKPSEELHAHHIAPFEQFGWERYAEANARENIQILCISCHWKLHERHKNFHLTTLR